jgi:hypothetical protein
VTRLWAGRGSNSDRANKYFFSAKRPYRLWDLPNFRPIWYRSSSPKAKRPGSQVNHSSLWISGAVPPISYMLSWRGQGRTQRYYFLRCTAHSCYTKYSSNIFSVNESPPGYLLNYKWATLRLICYTKAPLPVTDNFTRILLKPLVVFERLMHHSVV